ncbi:MAG: rod shape-determining protein RodA [Firmicutes bacterium]|nr:rod shape-determining protein RodA [Bacillota bacterium]
MSLQNPARKQSDQIKRVKQKRKIQSNQKARRRRGITNNFDWVTMGVFVAILAVSLFVMSTAASSAVEGDPTFYLRRHAFMMMLGIGAFVFVMLFDYRRCKELTKPAYIGINALLLITLIFGYGDGANRWIFGFQPSELAKLVMIVLYAAFLDQNRRQLQDPKFVLKSMIYMGVPMALIFFEPDLGTTLVFGVIMMVMLYVSGANRKVVGGVLGFVVGFIAIVFISLFFYTDHFTVPLEGDIPWLPLAGYQLMRLAIFINPEMDAMGDGYHIIQSKIAVGSGGLFGKGYGEGTQVQGNFLPEHHTDFIFSVIAEEFGFLMTAGVVLLLMVLVLRLMRTAFIARDFYGTLIISGICSMMLFQMFENIGMAMGIMPVTGLPLPFFSYGGTNLIINMAWVGLVFSISLRGRRGKR